MYRLPLSHFKISFALEGIGATEPVAHRAGTHSWAWGRVRLQKCQRAVQDSHNWIKEQFSELRIMATDKIIEMLKEILIWASCGKASIQQTSILRVYS